MAATIEKKIKQARPPFKKVSPLVYRLNQGYALINFAIGLLLWYVAERTTNDLPLFGHIISFQMWSVIFIALSVAMVYGLIANNWAVMRRTLVGGLLVKTFWTLSLFALALKGLPVLDITILWLFLAWTQGWAIVHFLPVIGWNGLDETVDSKNPERQEVDK